jgi:hypothetical protein
MSAVRAEKEPSGSRHATVAIPSLGVLNLIEFEAPA